MSPPNPDRRSNDLAGNEDSNSDDAGDPTPTSSTNGISPPFGSGTSPPLGFGAYERRTEFPFSEMTDGASDPAPQHDIAMNGVPVPLGSGPGNRMSDDRRSRTSQNFNLSDRAAQSSSHPFGHPLGGNPPSSNPPYSGPVQAFLAGFDRMNGQNQDHALQGVAMLDGTMLPTLDGVIVRPAHGPPANIPPADGYSESRGLVNGVGPSLTGHPVHQGSMTNRDPVSGGRQGRVPMQTTDSERSFKEQIMAHLTDRPQDRQLFQRIIAEYESGVISPNFAISLMEQILWRSGDRPRMETFRRLVENRMLVQGWSR